MGGSYSCRVQALECTTTAPLLLSHTRFARAQCGLPPHRSIMYLRTDEYRGFHSLLNGLGGRLSLMGIIGWLGQAWVDEIAHRPPCSAAVVTCPGVSERGTYCMHDFGQIHTTPTHTGKPIQRRGIRLNRSHFVCVCCVCVVCVLCVCCVCVCIFCPLSRKVILSQTGK